MSSIIYALNDVTVSGLENLPKNFDLGIEREKPSEYGDLASLGRHGTGYILAPNHTSYFDAPLLLLHLYGGLRTWLSPFFDHYHFTVGNCWTAFNNPILSTFSSLGGGLPVQGERISTGENVRERYPEWVLQNPRFLGDITRVLKENRSILMFPEGRIWQDGVEHRSSDGRYIPSYPCSPATLMGTDPYEKLGPLRWGIGRLVARTNCKVIPIAHIGNDNVCPLVPLTKSFDFRKLRLVGQKVDTSAILVISDHRLVLANAQHRFRIDMFLFILDDRCTWK